MKNISIVGLGSIGQRHAKNAKMLYPTAQLHFVRTHPLVDEISKSLEARVVGKIADVPSGEGDLVILASPSANHIDLLPELIERGCDLLIEKPIVTTFEDTKVIEFALEKANPAIRVAGFNFRYVNSLRQIKKIIDSGQLGRLVRASLVAGQWLPDWRKVDYRTTYSADANRGGGVELDLVHEIDVMRWLFGDCELIAARGGQLSRLELTANDTSVMLCQSHGGTLIQISLDYVSRKRVRRYEIVGEDGSLFWSIDGSLELVTTHGREMLLLEEGGFNIDHSYQNMLKVFQNRDLTEREWHSYQTIEDGLKSGLIAIEARSKGKK